MAAIALLPHDRAQGHGNIGETLEKVEITLVGMHKKLYRSANTTQGSRRRLHSYEKLREEKSKFLSTENHSLFNCPSTSQLLDKGFGGNSVIGVDLLGRSP